MITMRVPSGLNKKLKTDEIHFLYIWIINNLFNLRTRSREK